MVLSLLQECELLKKENKDLKEKLIEIPSKRNIEVRIVEKKGKIIAKPRFFPPQYEWAHDRELKIKLRNYLAEIYFLLNILDFEWDKEVLRMVDPKNINEKWSVVALLEKDVWFTDEVYGDYLIERNLEKKQINIYYYRRGEKRKRLEEIIDLSNLSIADEMLKKIIKVDAKKQIVREFERRWNKIYDELIHCQTLIKVYKSRSIKSTNLKLVFDKINELINILPEAALLSLGAVSEQWALRLGEYNSFRETNRNFSDLLNELLRENKITKRQVTVLGQLRKHYNRVKHEGISVSKKQVQTYYEEMKKWDMFQS